MKNLDCILFTIVLSLATNALAQNNQVDPILEVEKDNCQGTTEVNYRSQKLTSPDGKTTVYFEGVLRRIGKKGDSRKDSYCWPLERRQTPILTMLIEKDGKIQKVSQIADPETGGYLISNPISFSSDGIYVISHDFVAWDGGDGSDTYSILDASNNYTVLAANECKTSSYGGDYLGFISATEVVFECGNGIKQYEIINLQNQSVRKVSESFVKSAKITKLYGTLSGEITILKRQVFSARK